MTGLPPIGQDPARYRDLHDVLIGTSFYLTNLDNGTEASCVARSARVFFRKPVLQSSTVSRIVNLSPGYHAGKHQGGFAVADLSDTVDVKAERLRADVIRCTARCPEKKSHVEYNKQGKTEKW